MLKQLNLGEIKKTEKKKKNNGYIILIVIKLIINLIFLYIA